MHNNPFEGYPQQRKVYQQNENPFESLDSDAKFCSDKNGRSLNPFENAKPQESNPFNDDQIQQTNPFNAQNKLSGGADSNSNINLPLDSDQLLQQSQKNLEKQQQQNPFESNPFDSQQQVCSNPFDDSVLDDGKNPFLSLD
eukprot:TRINITY_DN9794_c0_g2_i2.p4 TRINITY_DN9794_c0_g2~~TRINITY_DN9794_c0_g2_i2.p4  ORF type:complete len:141 (-),score=25.13 TRINITY_DN9794_c0_g2_i2:574-996(-)